MEVEIVRWPEEQKQRDRLAATGFPRLLLVGNGFEPPLCVDLLEDWARSTDPDRDVIARAEALAQRWGNVQDEPAPRLHDEGILEFRTSRIEVSPLQTLLMRPMVDQFERVVAREDLVLRGWRRADVHRNTLDAHMFRLRNRIGAVGLTLRTVRSRGYLLAAAV